jgi:hypothetical protein
MATCEVIKPPTRPTTTPNQEPNPSQPAHECVDRPHLPCPACIKAGVVPVVAEEKDKP